MSKRYWTIVVAIALAAAVAGMYLASRLSRPTPVSLASGTAFPEPMPLKPFTLMDTRRQTVTPEGLRGHPTLVFFGFTHCPDVCPTTLALLTGVQKQLAVDDEELAALKVALITVDPERDTPEQMGRYISAFGGDLIGLTGSAPEIVRAQKSFGVAASRADQPGGGYSMDHSATVFLLDAQARRVAVFTPPLRAEAIRRDIAALAPSLGAGK
jgi:protein SCO1